MTKVKMTVSAPYVHYERFSVTVVIDLDRDLLLDMPEEGDLGDIEDNAAIDTIKDLFFNNEPYTGEYEYRDDCDTSDWGYYIEDIFQNSDDDEEE